jgi:hypothetical protein
MSKAVRTLFCVGFSVALFAAVAMTQSSRSANTTSADKSKEQQHHSKLSKAAFWRHRKDASKNAKQPEGPQAQSQSPAKKAQLKQVSANSAVSKKQPKPGPDASQKETRQQHSAKAGKTLMKSTNAKSNSNTSTTTKVTTTRKAKSSNRKSSVNKAAAQQNKQQPQTLAMKQ